MIRLLVCGTICLSSAALFAAEAVEAKLHRAIAAVEGSLRATPHNAAWREYLRLDELRRAADADIVADPAMRAVVVDVQRRLIDLSVGSPSSDVVALRTALDRFVAARCRLPVNTLVAQVKALPTETHFASPDEVRSARARLREAIAALDRKLSAEEHGDSWRRFLRWTELETALSVADNAELILPPDFEHRVGQKFPGADSAEFAAVRKAIRDHRRAAGLGDDDATRAEAKAQAEKLAAALEAWSRGEADRAADLEAAYRWWADRSVHADVLADIRLTVEQPNFLLDVSGPFLTRVARENVDETRPVRDVILDTDIYGTGRTVGQVGVRIVPDEDRAAFEVTFSGANNSDTVGYNGPVRIFSRGLTNFSGRKRVWFDADGIHADGIDVQARTRSSTKGVSTTLPRLLDRPVRKIAAKQIQKKKGKADAIASCHARQQIAAGFDSDADVEFAGADRSFKDQFLRKLIAAGHSPRRLDFSTTQDRLRVVMLHGGSTQLGAVTAPPESTADADVALRLHESAVNHMALALLGGKTIDNTELESDEPDADDEEDGDGPWSITFNAEEPIKLSFGDDTFGLRIRGDQFTSGEKSYRGMDISVAYKVVRTDGRLTAVRQGEIAIFPPDYVRGGGKRLSIGQQTIRKILERKLADVLKPELRLDDPLDLPDDLKDAGPLAPSDFVTRDGWLAVRLNGAPASNSDEQ